MGYFFLVNMAHGLILPVTLFRLEQFHISTYLLLQKQNH
jgi:hypothetical protein